MARPGRKRKAGPRTKGGRLKQDGYPYPKRDKGSEWVQARRSRFGEHYGSALGRAYAAGLLGDEAEARIRLDVGKKFARLYSRFIEVRRYTCPLGRDVPAHSVTLAPDPMRAKQDQDWLFDAMVKLDDDGARPWLDQLLSEAFTDTGPAWLERLLGDGKHPADAMVLKAAIRALDAIG